MRIGMIFKNPLMAISASGFAWLSIKYMPSITILWWLVVAVALDLASGLLKAWSKGEVTTSTGLRKTVTKIGSYVVTVVAVIILVNVIGLSHSAIGDLTVLIDALMGFMVFIELYSIMENIDEAFPDSPLTKFFIKPMLKFLKGKLKNNPINNVSGTETRS